MASKTKVASTKKIGQNDLRKLMKQHKASKKIDSPLAKYNKLNQLVCIVCQQQVKSEVLWNAHLQSKSHKQNHDIWKSKQHAPQEPVSSQIHAAKRHMEEKGYAAALKKQKPDAETISTRLAPANYSSSEDEEESSTTHPQPAADPPTNASALPSDFFDSNGKQSGAGSLQTADTQTADSQTDAPAGKNPAREKTMADILPEGFFDDPVQDAKARDIVYVDKNEVQWEQFQREMKEQTKVSELLQDEVDEEVQEERDLAQVDEQIEKWSRLNNLQERKEAWSVDSTDTQPRDGDTSGSSDDEDVSLDWRAKSCKR